MAKKSDSKPSRRSTMESPVEFIPCYIKPLDDDLLIGASEEAISINPVNAPSAEALKALEDSGIIDPQMIAGYTTKVWSAKGANLGMAFIDNPPEELKKKLLFYMNKWGKNANVKIREASRGMAEMRLTREESGYWSYLGNDCLHIPKSQATMCLQGWTMKTRDDEWDRVVTHEMGHGLGFPHEHMRQALVNRLDVKKTLAYFWQTQRWNESITRANVLTPIKESSLLNPTDPDETSIMSYRLPGSITKDGRPIVGGVRINETDHKYAGKIYPNKVDPTDPEEPVDPVDPVKPPSAGAIIITMPAKLEPGNYKLVKQ